MSKLNNFKTNSMAGMATPRKGNAAMLERSTKALLAEELRNGTITKESFLSMDKLILPENIKANPLLVLALNYNRDSKVGIWTDKAMNICTALASEFVDESGKGASKHFMKAFKVASKNGKVKGYKRIFTDELNVLTFTLRDNDKFKVTAYYVSNREIELFRDRIKSLDLSELTEEDVKNIQADLWYLFRAWQESSIDMTKDKSKAYNIMMDEILGSIKVRTGVSFSDIRTNEYTLKAAKYNKNIKTEELPTICVDFAEYDDEDDDFCETSLSEMQHEIRKVAEQELQVVAEGFMAADITRYERYNEMASEYPELAMTTMDLFKIIKDYNNVNRQEKKDGKKLTSRDYALLRGILYSDAKETGVAIEDVAQVVLGVAGASAVYSYVNDDGEEVIVIGEFDPAKMSKQLYAAELLLNNIMVLEKGILYNSEMIYEEQYILTEIEPYHVFADVENGTYKMVNGEAYDANGNLLFDSNCTYNGEVLVNDNGVFYLYDPLCEVEDIPSINAVFTHRTIEDDEVSDDYIGVELEGLLSEMFKPEYAGNREYTLEGDTLFINGLDVACVDAGYALADEELEVVELSKFYGIGGSCFKDGQEEPMKRNNKFLLLSYNVAEVEDYINNITQYC